MDPSTRTKRSRQRLRSDRIATRVVLALAVAALALLAAAPSPARSSEKTRVTIVGDSIMASFDYAPAARRSLARGLVLRTDNAVCRRLVVASCPFQGSTPPTALDVVRAGGRSARPGRRDQRRLQRLGRGVRRRPRARGASGSRGGERDLGDTSRGGLATRGSTPGRTCASVRRPAGGRASWSRTGMPTVATDRGFAGTACT